MDEILAVLEEIRDALLVTNEHLSIIDDKLDSIIGAGPDNSLTDICDKINDVKNGLDSLESTIYSIG